MDCFRQYRLIIPAKNLIFHVQDRVAKIGGGISGWPPVRQLLAADEPIRRAAVPISEPKTAPAAAERGTVPRGTVIGLVGSMAPDMRAAGLAPGGIHAAARAACGRAWRRYSGDRQQGTSLPQQAGPEQTPAGPQGRPSRIVVR